MDGGHTLERCYEVTEATLQAVFNELFSQRIVFEGMLLKPNMVVSGKDCAEQAAPEGVAERRSAASRASCRRPCRGSSSSPAARATRRRPPTSRDERPRARTLGAFLVVRARAPGAVLKAWRAKTTTSRPARRPSPTAPT